MAVVRVWWHQAPALASYNNVPLVVEPEISAENVVASGVAANTGAAPPASNVAVVHATIQTYYRVRHVGDSTAATTSDKFVKADELTDIAVQVGDTISFIE